MESKSLAFRAKIGASTASPKGSQHSAYPSGIPSPVTGAPETSRGGLRARPSGDQGGDSSGYTGLHCEDLAAALSAARRAAASSSPDACSPYSF